MLRTVVLAAGLAASAMVSVPVPSRAGINDVDGETLERIKGIGPAKARAILDERSAHGPFEDAADVSRRVRGMGPRTVARLEAAGLAVDDPANASTFVAALRAAAAAGERRSGGAAPKKTPPRAPSKP